MRHAAEAVLQRRQNMRLALVFSAGKWNLGEAYARWSGEEQTAEKRKLRAVAHQVLSKRKLGAVASGQQERWTRGFQALVLGEWLKEARRSRFVKTAAEDAAK